MGSEAGWGKSQGTEFCFCGTVVFHKPTLKKWVGTLYVTIKWKWVKCGSRCLLVRRDHIFLCRWANCFIASCSLQVNGICPAHIWFYLIISESETWAFDSGCFQEAVLSHANEPLLTPPLSTAGPIQSTPLTTPCMKIKEQDSGTSFAIFIHGGSTSSPSCLNAFVRD